jgi:hypothetical protein
MLAPDTEAPAEMFFYIPKYKALSTVEDAVHNQHNVYSLRGAKVRSAYNWGKYLNIDGEPSCTPGRAAIQTGRIPNRSGMTTVAFQGQGGGLPHAEWTLASVLKKGRTTSRTCPRRNSRANRFRRPNMPTRSSSWTWRFPAGSAARCGFAPL